MNDTWKSEVKRLLAAACEPSGTLQGASIQRERAIEQAVETLCAGISTLVAEALLEHQPAPHATKKGH